jgi:hypothetical protein
LKTESPSLKSNWNKSESLNEQLWNVDFLTILELSFPCNLAENDEKEDVPDSDLKELEESNSPSSAMSQMLGWSLFLVGVIAVGAGIACFLQM